MVQPWSEFTQKLKALTRDFFACFDHHPGDAAGRC
jgi:hypothetical protein